MKAVMYTSYGSPDVLRLTEIDKPEAGEHQVLVKVMASSVNAADLHMLKGESLLVRLMAGGPNTPKRQILGADVAGVVEAVGAGVTRFKPGDAVYGDLSGCGGSALMEYTAVPESALVLMPTGLSFVQAAALPLAGITALQAVRDKAHIKAGQKVLITGASGGVGVYTVQMAKHYGAHVTATCSTSKMDRVRALGADVVLDYTKTDFTKLGVQYDVILDIAAYRPLSDYGPILREGGLYVLVGGAISRIMKGMLLGPLASLRGGKTYTNLSAKVTLADMETLSALFLAGALVPVIDRCYPLSEAAQAFRDVDEGRVRGKVVISVADVAEAVR